MIGQVISHYRIVARLGEGGMGSVYLAEDLHLGRNVAIKFPVDAPVAHHFRARFLREARAASSLNHPNVASVYDYGETSDGRPFIVMEFIKGQTLGELIDDEDTVRIQALYPARRPQVQVVISDGLNANAVNENLRSVLPGIRRELLTAGHHISDIDMVIENGRVRAGYHVGALLEAEIIIHLIGERPGTGINTLSA